MPVNVSQPSEPELGTTLGLLAGPGLSYDTPRQDFQVNQLLMARDLVTSLLLRIIIAPCL